MSDAAKEQCVDASHKCIQCKKTKCEKNFRVYRGERREVCTSCEAKNAREVQTRKLRKAHGDAVSHITGDLKHCKACDTIKSIKDFSKDKSKDGHKSKCDCCVEENKPLMNNAQLAEYRAEHGPLAILIKPGWSTRDENKFLDEKSEVSEARPESVQKLNEGISDVVNTGKELAEEAKEIVGDAKEVATEAKGWWSRLRAWWKNL